MPKITKMYEKSRKTLKHNMGGFFEEVKLPPIPRSSGVATCKAECNATFQKDNDAVKLAKCIADCNAKLAAGD